MTRSWIALSLIPALAAAGARPAVAAPGEVAGNPVRVDPAPIAPAPTAAAIADLAPAPDTGVDADVDALLADAAAAIRAPRTPGSLDRAIDLALALELSPDPFARAQ